MIFWRREKKPKFRILEIKSIGKIEIRKEEKEKREIDKIVIDVERKVSELHSTLKKILNEFNKLKEKEEELYQKASSIVARRINNLATKTDRIPEAEVYYKKLVEKEFQILKERELKNIVRRVYSDFERVERLLEEIYNEVKGPLKRKLEIYLRD